MERDVTLMEMLDAREARAGRQRELLAEYRCPLISFSLNIAGPVKNGPVLRRAFREGLVRLEAALAARGLSPLHREEIDRPTGCEALWAVDGPGRAIKELCTAIEDGDALGRLFDLDVLAPGGEKWGREQLGLSPRPCLVCGQPGKGCASRRLHSVEELQARTQAILRDFFAEKDGELLAAQAARALLYEVCTTPKPGLVDRHNNGSHRDMDVFTFLDSTAALLPYFRRAVELGQRTAGEPPEHTFSLLREAGVRGEGAMLRATGGVNTHKGAVFSLGCALGAAGRLWTPAGPCREPELILAECGRMAAPAVERDFAALTLQSARTAGERFFLQTGLRGVRGEVAEGFPAIRRISLPALKAALEGGASLEEAGVSALLALMAHTVDTNLVARGGQEGQQWTARQARELLAGRPCPDAGAVEDLNREMVARNLSPGGCADLLAITYWLWFLREPEQP